MPCAPASSSSCWITISVIAYSPSPKWWKRIRPCAVGDVDRRPEVIREGAPDAVVAVDRDGELDAQGAGLRDDVVEVPLETELGGVDADDGQPGVRVFRGPGPDVGQRAQPVDARVGPEVDEDDAPLEPLGRQRLRVEPARRAIERGQVAPRPAAGSTRRPGDGRSSGSGRACWAGRIRSPPRMRSQDCDRRRTWVVPPDRRILVATMHARSLAQEAGAQLYMT